MTVVERRERSGSRDQFPIGMRVLAVDDDPTCLKVLESLLLRCQYHVTTTNQAIKALAMLRENKDQFDLVISDVHMPDMDGFKLLELVGLEMDLPVIMLSSNGETQAVMKGITHGACDYLLKPVRIEELKNIWQHVIRRKKFDARDQNNLDNGEECDKNQLANSEGAQGSQANSSCDQKLNRKRKDQNEEDEDDGDDNMHENEDPSTQKKPRVVWSVDLHRKFVAAVNQLGLDKAVPKRILDLMNVEGLSRENVASHLQKYRLYLKRLGAVANQQANMVAALRGRESSYLPMGSLDGYANLNSLIGSRPLSGPRLNSYNGYGLLAFAPSGTSQLGRILNNTNNSLNDVGKLQGIGLPSFQGNQQGTLIQGMQQPPKAVQEANKSLPGGLSSSGFTVGHTSNSFTSAVTSLHMLSNQQQTQSGVLSNQSSVRTQPSLGPSDPFEIRTGVSSRSADLGRCNETWQGAVSSSTYCESTMSLPFSSNIRNNVSSMVSNLGSSGQGNLQNQASSVLTATAVNGDANLFNIGSSGNCNLKWDEPVRGQSQNANLRYNSSSKLSRSNIHITDQNAGNQNLGGGFSNKKMDIPIMGQTNFGASSIAQDSMFVSQLHYKDVHLFEDVKFTGGISAGGFGLDDLVANTMVKPESDDFAFIDGDIGCGDLYSLGACM